MFGTRKPSTAPPRRQAPDKPFEVNDGKDRAEAAQPIRPGMVYTVTMATKRGARREAEDRYYKLDNGAVFLAAITGKAGAYVFRFSCDLKDTVRLDVLQDSLEVLAPRFPYFFAAMRNGVFWYYLDPVLSPPRVEAEGRCPARAIPYRHGRPLVRVVAYGRRVACEFHHAVTDGTGALAFLRALVAEYLVRLGLAAPADRAGQVLAPDDPEDPEEAEDAYARYFDAAAPAPEKTPRAFLLPGRRYPRFYRETVATLRLPDVLALAKERKATVTEFLSAAYLAALQDVHEGLPPARRRKARKYLSLNLPVNLRKIYPSRTLRNFFLCATVSIDLRLGRWEFDEILARVHHQLKLGMEKKELLRQIKRNVGGERNPLGRPMFLPLKNLLLRAINATIGVDAFSGSVSNVGPVSLPDAFARHVESFALTPSRSRATGANLAVLSWKDELRLTVGSAVESPDIERAFVRTLRSFGLEIRVESNIDPFEGNSP